MRHIFELFRLPNLLFLAYLQASLYFIFVEISFDLTAVLFYLIVFLLPTLFIAAFGYVFNDHVDQESDRINKKRPYGLNRLSSPQILTSIWLTAIMADLSVIFAAIWIRSWGLYFLYSLLGLLLIVYSLRLKCIPFAGNLLIGILSVISLALPICFASFQINDFSLNQPDSSFLFFYLISIMLITLLREIIKDLEDGKGDISTRCNTAVVKYGTSHVTKWTYALILLIGVIFIIWMMESNFDTSLFIFIFSIIPLVVFFQLFNTSNDYRKMVRYLKIEMLIASILPFLYKFIDV